MAFDRQDRMWVADACNHRIQAFSTEGKLLGLLGHAKAVCRANCIILTI